MAPVSVPRSATVSGSTQYCRGREAAFQRLTSGPQIFLAQSFTASELKRAVEDALERRRLMQDNKRAEVLALVEESGGVLSLAEIGRRVGLSRESVRKIVRAAGLLARKRWPRQQLICPQCGKVFRAGPFDIKRGRRFCSLECAGQAQRGPRVARMTFRCEVCGQTYTRKASEVKDGTRFCSKVCHGKWLNTILPRERGRFNRIEAVFSVLGMTKQGIQGEISPGAF